MLSGQDFTMSECDSDKQCVCPSQLHFTCLRVQMLGMPPTPPPPSPPPPPPLLLLVAPGIQEAAVSIP